MKLIQLLLIPSLIILWFLSWKYVRSRILTKVLFLCSVLLGIYFVLFPEMSTSLANRLGVGRGTDLVMYIAIIVFAFGYVLMYAKINHQQDLITEIVRQMAIEHAEPPSSHSSITSDQE